MTKKTEIMKNGEPDPSKKEVTMRTVLKYYIKKSKPFKWLILLSVIWSIWVSIFTLLTPIYQTKLVDIFSESWIDRTELAKLALTTLWIIALLEFGTVISRRLVWIPVISIETWVMQNIFEECFQYIHKHSYRFFTSNLTWSLVAKITKLWWSYENVYDVFIFNVLNTIIFIPLSIWILLKENLMIGLIFIAFTIIYATQQVIMFKIGKKYEIQANERSSKANWELSDSIINNFNVLIFSSLPYEFKRFKKTLWTSMNLRRKNRTIAEISNAIWWVLITSFVIWSLYLWIKARWAWLINAWVVILIQLYIIRIVNQLSSIRHILKSMNRALWESTEMLQILMTPHEIIDYSDKKLKVKSWKIEFENINFSYEDWKQVFKDLNLSIKPWEKIAIVWTSWSWKTTLIKLLFRFFDINWWKIQIDWEDIKYVAQDSLREQLSMVPQDPVLFHRTIKENIAYWKPNATDEEIIAASKMAKCHEFITNLKDWYNSYVWERGVKLSWWEKQRIAIARAILENKKILVMDEATSSLDSESEQYIQDAMDEVMKNKTCIVIAHRLSTIVKMDKIIVMENWKIIERWSHNELINKKDWIYCKLRNIQSWWFIIWEENTTTSWYWMEKTDQKAE